MKRSLKFSLLAGLLVLLVFVVPSVGAFEISGMYTEEGQKWLNDHWGENITLGDVARIAYTSENLEKIKENVDPALLEKVWSQPYYWGDQYPPSVTDTKNTAAANSDSTLTGNTLNTASQMSRGGISLSANPTGYSGGYITYGGSGTIYGYTGTVSYFKVEAKLYGDSTLLQTSYKEKYSYTNDPRVTLSTSGVRTPVSGTLYQAQIVGQSTSPSYSANTWSTSYLY